MTKAAIAIARSSGRAAGEELAASVLEQLEGVSPDALIVFASPDQDHQALLNALISSCKPGVLVGCSSAGEFTHEEAGVGMTCVVGLASPEMRFTASLGKGLRGDRAAAAAAGGDGVSGPHTPS
jgi:hypothetical protein